MLQIYFVCLTYLLIVTDTVRCQPDYIFNYDVGGWLKLHTIPATWEAAMLRCHSEGAVLASPLYTQLVTALHSLMTQFGVNQHIFLGTHDLYSKGDFGSVEGVPLSDMEIRWGAHHKKADNGHCLTMSIDGHEHYMHTSSCSEPLPYICYKALVNHTMNECGTFDNEYQLNERTGSLYKVHKESQPWDRAYSICTSEGAHLVILNDEEEARIVTEMYPDCPGGCYVPLRRWDSFHIGLRAWGENRTWMTIHGERFEDVFHEWYPGQPDNTNGDQNIGNLYKDGTLDDNFPSIELMFVCEKPQCKSTRSGSPPGEEELLRL